MTIRTTRELLHTAFRDHVYPVTAVHVNMGVCAEGGRIAEENKRKFLEILRHRTHQLKTEPSIRKHHLVKLAIFAESLDWKDPHEHRQLYRGYRQLTGEEFR